MSVVAWDGESLVGDGIECYGDYRLTRTKVFQINQNTWAGFAGKTSDWHEVLEWLQGKVNMPTRALEFTAIIVEMRGGKPEVFSMGYNLTKVPEYNRHYAIGAGADMAMTLMHIGYSAQSAVEVCCDINIKCARPLDIFKIFQDDIPF